MGHALNNTASEFAVHSSIVEAAGLPVAAAFGFMPGLMLGLRKGYSRPVKALMASEGASPNITYVVFRI